MLHGLVTQNNTPANCAGGVSELTAFFVSHPGLRRLILLSSPPGSLPFGLFSLWFELRVVYIVCIVCDCLLWFP